MAKEVVLVMETVVIMIMGIEKWGMGDGGSDMCVFCMIFPLFLVS